MRAVNLIPVGERRGIADGGSGLASYIVLGVLAARRGDERCLHAQQPHARRPSPRAGVGRGARDRHRGPGPGARQLHQLLALRQKRSETIRALAASRFDWSKTLHEVARTIPADAWLTSMRGTVSPNVSAEGGGTDPLRTRPRPCA